VRDVPAVAFAFAFAFALARDPSANLAIDVASNLAPSIDVATSIDAGRRSIARAIAIRRRRPRHFATTRRATTRDGDGRATARAARVHARRARDDATRRRGDGNRSATATAPRR
jgi:hypothetical protein